MPTQLAELAQLVDGRLTSGASLEITGADTLDVAGPSEVTLLDSPDKAHRLPRSRAAAVIVASDFSAAIDRPAIVVADVHAAFAQIVRHFRPIREASESGVRPGAILGRNVQIAADATVHAGASIGDDVRIGARSIVHSGAHVMAGCVIGEDVAIFPNATLYENTRVGNRCIIHGGAVLGAYGFGYKVAEGRHVLSAQLGYVELEDDVEVGACTTIDRGTYGATRIGQGTKIDNLVMIAHNCRLGKHNLICSQVGIAGSTTTGDYVVMAGQVGVRDHVHIGARSVLGAKCGVTSDVREGVHMLGAPAVPEREQKLLFALISKLPEMRKQLKELQRDMELLQAESPSSNRVQSEAA